LNFAVQGIKSMAISFVKEQKKQKYLIAVFAVVILIIGVFVYQNFFRGKANIIIPDVAEELTAKKAEINFMALENPILGILQQFEEIKLTSDVENSAGRPNPFLPY